jgi:hypothetical protein
MPQLGFNNIKGADVTFLDPILMAEPLPAQSTKVVAVVVRHNTRLPRRGAAH